ncbi:monooxygenase, putative [Trypanosoma brucei brucei TREU927]|uniref:Monooxygenase, putative n=1 Tax=Trypanosoma brucei brucei (strain 927/4 GUTat10.1) TaxID=185431 RepID=Q38G02_TRYB2|nr:monooxygenase, putative [Trypanosoma brucei brucei TREU927]EAN76268.1 monooxygenase, putative [Trypanosoma brucei brucei TREU927]
MRVVIVGAGLSGLSLAAFLRRINIDCVVLEQSPFLRATYQPPYTLYANALSCFKAFELDDGFYTGDAISESHFGIQNERLQWLLRVRNRVVQLQALGQEDCVPLSTAPPANSDSTVSRRLAEELKQDLGCVPLRTTFSADYLRSILRKYVQEIRFNANVVDLRPHDGIKGGVHVVLDNGQTEWGDVVVGADGGHSTVRKLLYPDEYIGTSCRTLGMTQVDGYVELGDEPWPTGESPAEVWGKRRVLSCIPLQWDGRRHFAFSATLYDPPTEIVDVSKEMDPIELREVYRSLLRREFASFGGDITNTLSRAELAIPSELVEVPVMPRWYNKRAVLIGEAAHASLPSFLAQDASLCVEDAALLSTSLVDVPLCNDAGFEYAFRQFETVRRDRIEGYIRQSRRARRFTSLSHTWLRNGMLSVIPSLSLVWFQRWLANWSYSAQQLEVDPKIKMETAYRN